MTDKEQIIIHEIDVKNCNFFLSSNKYCGLYSTGCRFVPDCDYKQLANKTQECEELKAYAQRQENQREVYYKEYLKLSQECEELKKQLKTSEKWRINAESLNEKLDIENTRYRKALEEIGGLVKNFCKDCDDYEDCNWDKEGCYYSLIPNLKDIINKAKGEE